MLVGLGFRGGRRCETDGVNERGLSVDWGLLLRVWVCGGLLAQGINICYNWEVW